MFAVSGRQTSRFAGAGFFGFASDHLGPFLPVESYVFLLESHAVAPSSS